MARELDDAILMLRVNEPELGLLLLKSAGSIDAVLACDRVMLEHRSDWLVGETIGLLRRTLQRLDVSSRSMFAIIEPGSCFAGMLYELVLAADRSYMLALPEDEGDSPKIAVDEFNFGLLPAVNQSQPHGDALQRQCARAGCDSGSCRAARRSGRGARAWTGYDRA